MKSKTNRWSNKWFGTIGFLLLVFGLFRLNYTKAENAARPTASATRPGLLPPRPTIFWSRVACVALGAGLMGHAISRIAERKRNQQQGPETPT